MKKAESMTLSIALVLSSVLSVPFLYRAYDEDFDDSEWRTYTRILVPFLGIVAAALHFLYTRMAKPALHIATKVLMGLVLLGAIYYTAFGIYWASSHVCDEIDGLCLTSATCLKSTTFEVYDTFLFISFSLLIRRG